MGPVDPGQRADLRSRRRDVRDWAHGRQRAVGIGRQRAHHVLSVGERAESGRLHRRQSGSVRALHSAPGRLAHAVRELHRERQRAGGADEEHGLRSRQLGERHRHQRAAPATRLQCATIPGRSIRAASLVAVPEPGTDRVHQQPGLRQSVLCPQQRPAPGADRPLSRQRQRQLEAARLARGELDAGRRLQRGRPDVRLRAGQLGSERGSIERWQFYDRVFDHTLTATGTHAFNSNFNGSLTVGQNLDETYFRQIDVFGQTWLAPTPYKLSNTTTRTLPSDVENRRRIEGYFAQASADLYDQVFLQARIRNDANSAFGVGHQHAWYPGGSIAWSFGKAIHLPETYISYGKLRVAYGESGQQPPLYATQNVYTTAAFADFNPGSLQGTTINGVGGLYPSGTVGNPNISPERVWELESGVDLSLLRGRAALSVTRYDSKSKDVI
ncbi:MAG: hypothetical protein DMD66_08675, partial [Gemmatimonadetes bacterium]